MANTVEIVIRALDATKGGFSSASRSLQSFGKLSGVVMGAAAVGAAALTSAYASMVKQSIDAADRLNDLSKQSGVSVETLDKMQFAAAQSGASLETLAKAAKELNRSIAEAGSNASSEAAKEFAEMGISARTASGQLKNVDQVMIEMADRFERQADGAEKVAAAQKLMGKAGAEMIPFLNEGGESIKRMGESIRPVSTEAAKMSDEFNDTLGRIGRKFTDFANEVTERSLPALNQLAKWFEDFTAKNYERSVSKIAGAMSFLSEASIAIRQLFQNGPDAGEAAFGEQIAKSIEDSLKSVTDKLSSGKPIELPVVAVTAKSLEDTGKLAQMYEDLFNSQLQGSARVTAEYDRGHRERMDQVNQLRASDEDKRAFELLSESTMQQQKTELFRSGLALRADLETAYNLGSLERTRMLLQSEQAERVAQLEGNRALIDVYVEQWRLAHQTIQSFGASLASSFSQNLGGALSDIIQNIGNAGDAAKRFGQAMLNSITNFIGQWVAAQITMRIMQAVFATTTAATSVAAAAAIGAAWAPAAALASLASFGANAGPASAAIASTVAVSKAASVFGGAFHGGTDFVPAEQSYLLNRGERVIQPSANEDLTSFLDGQGGGGTIVEVHLDGEVLARGIGNLSRDGRLSIAARSVT